MKNIRFIDMVIVAMLVMTLVFPAVFYSDFVQPSDVIETTKRIQGAEAIIEALNKQIRQLDSLVQVQRSKIDSLRFLANRAIRVDSLSMAKAKEWGWIKKKEE